MERAPQPIDVIQKLAGISTRELIVLLKWALIELLPLAMSLGRMSNRYKILFADDMQKQLLDRD